MRDGVGTVTGLGEGLCEALARQAQPSWAELLPVTRLISRHTTRIALALRGDRLRVQVNVKGRAPATIHLTFTPHGRLVLVEPEKVASEDFEVDVILEGTVEELVDLICDPSTVDEAILRGCLRTAQRPSKWRAVHRIIADALCESPPP